MGKGFLVLLAAIGGVVAGILMAPKSGEETRRDIKNKAKEYHNKSKAGMKEVKKGAAMVGGELAESAEAMKGIAKDAADGVKRTAGRVKEEATSRAKVIQGEVNQTAAETRRAASQA